VVTLAGVGTGALQTLLEGLQSGRVAFPPSTFALQTEGLGDEAPALAGLGALGRAGAVALIEAVLAERQARPRPAELVWTGPEQRTSGARDTAVVLHDLFTRAQERVLLAGFTFDHASEVLRPLWEAAKRGVAVRLFVDAQAAPGFATTNWPFGPPLPELFLFRPAEGVYASLHAKCVVVDGRWSFVTSANFTARGQSRNVEVGVVLDDAHLAEGLEKQFQPGGHFAAVTP
jgi:phosphatidylserine/phosphatidylglycerophosphate/cardiolipin synthase-like enzyme